MGSDALVPAHRVRYPGAIRALLRPSRLACALQCTMLRSVLRATPPPAPRSSSPLGLPEWARHASTSSHTPSFVPKPPLSARRRAIVTPPTVYGPPRMTRTSHLAGRGFDTLLLARPTTSCRTLGLTPLLALGTARTFHSTRRNELSPLPLLAGLLKVSIVLSQAPAVWTQN